MAWLLTTKKSLRDAAKLLFARRGLLIPRRMHRGNRSGSGSFRSPQALICPPGRKLREAWRRCHWRTARPLGRAEVLGGSGVQRHHDGRALEARYVSEAVRFQGCTEVPLVRNSNHNGFRRRTGTLGQVEAVHSAGTPTIIWVDPRRNSRSVLSGRAPRRRAEQRARDLLLVRISGFADTSNAHSRPVLPVSCRQLYADHACAWKCDCRPN
jgi:hypothetical protein